MWFRCEQWLEPQLILSSPDVAGTPIASRYLSQRGFISPRTTRNTYQDRWGPRALEIYAKLPGLYLIFTSSKRVCGRNFSTLDPRTPQSGMICVTYLWFVTSQSHKKSVDRLLVLLDTLEQWIIEIPPLQSPQRFGNLAFRTWGQQLEKVESPVFVSSYAY